jgi:hypothetical protein
MCMHRRSPPNLFQDMNIVGLECHTPLSQLSVAVLLAIAIIMATTHLSPAKPVFLRANRRRSYVTSQEVCGRGYSEVPAN